MNTLSHHLTHRAILIMTGFCFSTKELVQTELEQEKRCTKILQEPQDCLVVKLRVAGEVSELFEGRENPGGGLPLYKVTRMVTVPFRGYTVSQGNPSIF